MKKTQKITRTMQMVATSKMRKAQERMQRTRPYAQRICQVISRIATSNPEYRHSFMQKRQIKKAAYITVSSDRDLCGGLNIKLFKELTNAVKCDQKQGIELRFCALGLKSKKFLRQYGDAVLGPALYLGDKPSPEQLIELVNGLLDEYQAGLIDALYICANEFVNTMIQNPTITQLLPITLETKTEQQHHDYIYEPDDARKILTTLLVKYIHSQVYQAVIENIACEQAARMVAMQNATENAKKMIDDLQLIYNKTRQASITRELAEIVAGAAAV